MIYTVYWLDGKREVLSGRSISDALNHVGYGQGALKALDFWSHGNCNDYKWDKRHKTWRKNTPQHKGS